MYTFLLYHFKLPLHYSIDNPTFSQSNFHHDHLYNISQRLKFNHCQGYWTERIHVIYLTNR